MTSRLILAKCPFSNAPNALLVIRVPFYALFWFQNSGGFYAVFMVLIRLGITDPHKNSCIAEKHPFWDFFQDATIP